MIRLAVVLVGLVTLAAVATACGETRNPIGDECLRNQDCLSGVCSDRACVAAPPLVTSNGVAEPPDETVEIPEADAAAAPADAPSDG